MRSIILRAVFSAALALGAIGGLAGTAQAVPVTWTLQGVTFDDGGTATGSFVYDADTNIFSGINITSSLNAALGLGTTYGVPTGSGFSTFFDTIVAFPPAGQPRLLFDLVSPMTNAGGTIAINLFAGLNDLEGICLDNPCAFTDPDRTRTITAGAITSVPEPATVAILAGGLVGFALLRRRRAA